MILMKFHPQDKTHNHDHDHELQATYKLLQKALNVNTVMDNSINVFQNGNKPYQ